MARLIKIRVFLWQPGRIPALPPPLHANFANHGQKSDSLIVFEVLGIVSTDYLVRVFDDCLSFRSLFSRFSFLSLYCPCVLLALINGSTLHRADALKVLNGAAAGGNRSSN